MSKESNRTGTDVSVSPSLVMRGTIRGVKVSVLRDDSCNKNVLSSQFIRKNRHLFDVRTVTLVVSHSHRNQIEKATELVINAKLQIGDYTYQSN